MVSEGQDFSFPAIRKSVCMMRLHRARGARELRCSFEARQTRSLSSTKDKIDLAESQGWVGGYALKKELKTDQDGNSLLQIAFGPSE